MRGVIFDLWNTLIGSGGPRLVARLADLIAGPDHSADSEEDVTDYLRSTGCLNRLVSPSEIAHDLWLRHNGGKPPSDFDKAVNLAVEQFTQQAVFLEGARELLYVLTKAGLRVGIVSNATSASLDVIERMGIRDATQDVWVSCVSGYLKPDPRAFEIVAKEWNLEPASICVVGDKITTDILGARLCMMQAIWFAPHLSRPVFSNPSSVMAVVNSLSQIPVALGIEGGAG